MKYLLLLLLLAAGVVYGFQSGLIKNPFDQGFKKVTIKSTTMRVWLADTPEKRLIGLSGHDVLEADQGMLFVFPDKDYHEFWMKGMKFPIDIIWIDDNVIVGITAQVPIPVVGQQMEVYRPPKGIDKVLEVRSDYAFMNRFTVGDRVTIE